MSVTSLADEKSAMRKAAYAARKASHADDPAGKATAAKHHARAVLGAEPGAVIAGYRPIRTEIDPTPLMSDLIADGHRVVVPVIEDTGLPLRFRQWWPDCAMEEGAFGAWIPSDGAWLDPEVMIAPLVAFDAGCWRLGYGGGFYDRTLARLSAQRPTRAIGFAYAAQQMARIPREPTDRRLDAVVTEAGVLHLEGK